MTESAEPSAPAASPGPPPGEVGAVARVPGALFSPVRTFESIARRPTWLPPLLVWIAVSFAFTNVMLPRIDFDRLIRSQFEKRNVTVPEERIQTIVASQKRSAPIIYNASAVVIPVVFSLLVALVCWGAFKAFGWDLTFRQSFGATTHAFLPLVVSTLIFLPVLLRQESVDPRTMGDLLLSNLGFLVDRSSSPAVHSILQSIDIFSIWTAVLLVIGLSAAARIRRGGAAGVVIGLWVLLILIKAGFAAIFG
jgi:hypothetical protein